jgi:malate dehydrogenase
MERADLLKDNGKIFIGQGQIIDAVAAADARIAVVGNPANTNCMIAASQAKRLPAERFTAMVRLDQNRAQTQLAKKAGVDLTAVKDIFIYGNHSPTMFPAFAHATIGGAPATKVITDDAWLQGPFCETVGKRGAAIIAARGASSAASAANALVDHVRSLVTPGAIHSVAVKSEGRYGFDANVWAGMPVRTTTPGSYEVIEGYAMDDFAKSKIAATNKELVEERAFVADMILSGTPFFMVLCTVATCMGEHPNPLAHAKPPLRCPPRAQLRSLSFSSSTPQQSFHSFHLISEMLSFVFLELGHAVLLLQWIFPLFPPTTNLSEPNPLSLIK